ncbi:MAG TPA: mercury(II) reductase [Pseudonocardiaceae bacterium]|nr:mercury(II) reductase [Pseudonocardiaceae bacterium]
MRYDLAVIGSGGAGFAAAIAARGKGRSVVMIERATVGGTCVNTGCVPSKAMLAARETGLARVMADKRELVASMRAEKYVGLAAEYGWPIVSGTARFAPGPVLKVGTETIEAAHYLIATGSAPVAPPIEGLTEYLTSTTAMELDELPGSMIVLGGGAVGLEQAELWQRLGVAVTVIEAAPRLAPAEEPEISAGIEQALRRKGIRVVTGTTVRHADELPAERVLVATGRRPVTDGLNLAEVGVKTGPRGEVVVDEQLRTGNPRIWAAGDVTGAPQFVYVAGAHGTLVVDNAFDDANRTLDYRALPRVTFTSPAIAAVGLTQAQAIEQGYPVESRVLPLAHVPRAVVDRDTEGMIKLVAHRDTGRLLGAHVLATGAGEVIAAAVHALANELTVAQLAEQWCAYMTMAEGLKLAAQTFTRDVTKLSCCAS